MTTALIFDLDGTLVDSREDIACSINATRSHYQLETLPVLTVMNAVGDGLGKLLERTLPADVDLNSARAVFSEHYAEHCYDKTRCFAGIEAVLEQAMSQNVPMAIVSNKPKAFCDAIVRGLGIDHFFPVVIGGDGVRKPAADPVLQAVHELSAQPHRSWMIGDNHTDIASGQAAGLHTVYCTWGFGETGAYTPERTIDDPARLGDLIS